MTTLRTIGESTQMKIETRILLDAVKRAHAFADSKSTAELSERFVHMKFTKEKINLSLHNETMGIVSWVHLEEEGNIAD